MAIEKETQSSPSNNRLIGNLPKIGIRPTIDGRRKGVRESLEDQTMGMARRTAEFLADLIASGDTFTAENAEDAEMR